MNLATIGWPSGTDTGWPSEPRNMLPGRVEGFPAGVQASANTAERLLSQAVGWWDADHYRDGDRLLRNRGVAGELLDLQLGSSDRVATSNDPKFLAPEDSGYVYLPGTSGPTRNSLSSPNEPALDITANIDVRVKVAADNWTPSEIKILASKESNINGGRGWFFGINTNGTIRFAWSTDGSNANQYTLTSTVAPTVNNGSSLWLRVAFDADNGASGRTATFSTSANGTSWDILGTSVTSAGATSIFSTSSDVTIGAQDANSPSGVFAGKVHHAQIWDGIEGSGGTKVLDIDCDAITSGSQTSFTAVTGQTVTINRSTSGRKTVAVPSRGNRGGAVFLFGTDDYMQVPDNDLLDFDNGDEITVFAVWRIFGSPNTDRHILAKTVGNALGSTSNTHLGWRLMAKNTSNYPRLYLSDGSVSAGNAASTITHIDGGLMAIGISTTATADISNNVALRVGRFNPLSPKYADMEFIAAAIFRRALTPAEIKTISDYFTARIA